MSTAGEVTMTQSICSKGKPDTQHHPAIFFQPGNGAGRQEKEAGKCPRRWQETKSGGLAIHDSLSTMGRWAQVRRCTMWEEHWIRRSCCSCCTFSLNGVTSQATNIKMLNKMPQKTKKFLVINWDSNQVVFHEACWNSLWEEKSKSTREEKRMLASSKDTAEFFDNKEQLCQKVGTMKLSVTILDQKMCGTCISIQFYSFIHRCR